MPSNNFGNEVVMGSRAIELERENQCLKEQVQSLAEEVQRLKCQLHHYHGTSVSQNTAESEIEERTSESKNSTELLVELSQKSWTEETDIDSDDETMKNKDPSEVVTSTHSAGANIMSMVPTRDYPVLTKFLEDGRYEVAEFCIKDATHAIDFTVGDVNGYTPLHYISVNTTEEQAERLLNVILDRLERFPGKDVIDWGKRDFWDFSALDVAAGNGHLFLWWSVIKKRKVLYYLEYPSHQPSILSTSSELTNAKENRPKILLRRPVNKEDWDKLNEGDQDRFDPSMGFREW